jgi:hypothetical protein
MKLSVYTTKDTAPASVAFAPTATTVGNQMTLSAASTALIVGDYIVDLSQNEVKKVVYKSDDINYRLDSAFTADLTAATVKRVARNSAKYGMISIAADKGGDISVAGITISSGSSITLSVSELDRATGSKHVTPVVVDGSTNNATVLVQ